jgi:hypothetical protein
VNPTHPARPGAARAPRFALALAVLVTLHAAAGIRPARGSGAWSTFLRPEIFADLVAGTDTVWCATDEAGLLFYDRVAGRFGSWTREPGGLASNHLTSLAFDRSGQLWIGTRDAGVSRLSPRGSWGLLNAFDGLPDLAVNVLRAQGDTLWIGTASGLALYNGVEITGRLPDGVNPSPFASDNITGIVVRGDTLWLATGAGVYYSRISQGLSSWTSPVTGLPGGPVDALATNGTEVWALASGGVWRAVAGDQWAPEPVRGAVHKLADDFGIVMASSDSGLFQTSGGPWTAINTALQSGIPATDVFAATTDAQGVVFAADHSGLYESQPDPTPWILRYPPGPPGNNCQNVVVLGAHTYMNTYDEGVGRYDGRDWTLFLPRPCTSDCGQTFYYPIYTFGMLADRQGQLWLGSWGVSVDAMDEGVPSVEHQWVSTLLADDRHTWLWSAAADSDGGRWFGMDTPCLGCDQQHDPIGIDYYSPSGIYRANYVPGKGDSAKDMANGQVRSLEYDAARRVMWVGYGGAGVQWFDLPGSAGVTDTSGAMITFNTLTDAARLDVFSVIPHRDSVWVFNTSDLRLYTAYGGSRTGVGYSIPAGPATRGAVHPLDVAADGTVWLGTSNGVRIYHPGGATEDLTTANSPLADLEVRAVRIDRATGVVWIGTASGLNRFDPGYVPPPPPQLPQLNVRVYPNPSPIANLLGSPLRVTGNGQQYSGRVYTVEGRLIRTLRGAGNDQVVWDGRDDHGNLVRPGLYFMRLEAGGKASTVRVSLLR